MQKYLNSIWKAQSGVADYIRNTELELQRKEQQEEKWSVRLGSLAKACSRISKVYISQIMMSLFTPTSPQRSEETFPKVLNKRDRSENALNVRSPQQEPRQKERKTGVGGVITKALDETYFTPMFFILYLFFIYHMYVFFYQQRNVWSNRKQSERMNVMEQREKS